jgi:uncharacterized protein YuzE
MVYLTDKKTNDAIVAENKRKMDKAKEELERKRENLRKKLANNKVLINYDKEIDIMDFFWGPDFSDNSRELKNVDVVVDIDKKGNIVGLEIDGFGTALKQSQKELDEMFESWKKRNKEVKKNGKISSSISSGRRKSKSNSK